jgi:hypothetical protein
MNFICRLPRMAALHSDKCSIRRGALKVLSPGGQGVGPDATQIIRAAAVSDRVEQRSPSAWDGQTSTVGPSVVVAIISAVAMNVLRRGLNRGAACRTAHPVIDKSSPLLQIEFEVSRTPSSQISATTVATLGSSRERQHKSIKTDRSILRTLI